MCGGAIISDFIPPVTSRKLTADYLWGNLSKAKTESSKNKKKNRSFEVEDDFEADFNDFNDDSGEEEGSVVLDAKPFEFRAQPRLSRGNKVKSLLKI